MQLSLALNEVKLGFHFVVIGQRARGPLFSGDVVDTGTSSWCGSTGLVSQTQRGGRSVGKGSGGSGMTRGDRRRNARRERLRGLLPRGGAVIGIHLAEDKQA